MLFLCIILKTKDIFMSFIKALPFMLSGMKDLSFVPPSISPYARINPSGVRPTYVPGSINPSVDSSYHFNAPAPVESNPYLRYQPQLKQANYGRYPDLPIPDYGKGFGSEVNTHNMTAGSKINYLKEKEGKNNSYTTRNMNGSSAYGKYQFMPSTATMYADRAGVKGDWRTPQNQETIMNEAMKDYESYLNKWGVPSNEGNTYAVHQLGPGRAKRYFNGELTDRDIKVMRDNLPDDLKRKATSRDKVLELWNSKYNP
jgi:hypothetical protein